MFLLMDALHMQHNDQIQQSFLCAPQRNRVGTNSTCQEKNQPTLLAQLYFLVPSPLLLKN